MILATGGAGYIGSIIVEQLLEKGERVVVLDNLSQGHRRPSPMGLSSSRGISRTRNCSRKSLRGTRLPR